MKAGGDDIAHRLSFDHFDDHAIQRRHKVTSHENTNIRVANPMLASRASVSSGLYTVSTSPTAHILIETNPQFTQYTNFISSNYLRL